MVAESGRFRPWLSASWRPAGLVCVGNHVNGPVDVG